MRQVDRRMHAFALFVMVLGALAGCTTSPPAGMSVLSEQYRLLAQATPCCASYREIRYAGISLGQETSAQITPESPVFEFPSGRSFFAAFDLPPGSQVLLVKTHPFVGSYFYGTAHVLIPTVLFLDADRNAVATVTPKYLPRGATFIGGPWGEAEIPVPRAARYFIVRASKGGSLEWSDSAQLSGYRHASGAPAGRITVLALGT